MFTRVQHTLEQANCRYPMHADPETGEWTWSDDGGWSGGFWPGLLTLTGERAAAAEATAKLRNRLQAPTMLRGLLFWYSAGLIGDPMAVEAAHALASTYDQAAGVIPPGDEDIEQYGWPRRGACVDGLPGTTPLLALVPEYRDLAESHARAHYAMCVRPDGSVSQTATATSRTTINGYSPTSTWSRAQAWAMLGFTQAAHLFPGLVGLATEVTDWYLGHVPPDLVCYWDFDDPAIPDAPRDTSATAIAAAAMAALAPLTSDRYREAAADAVAALTKNHVNRHGGLIDGCYNRVKGLATSNELIWGDYFLLEATLTLEEGTHEY
ncbi:hypothetical protein ACIBHX_24615 [Nonomuraea sp. NPDC050536]|uniref:hypothetical protein n=1 Tax=Nonomuraea sp. NPDC050536 TaxID=3364366 RepID=UPI0037C733EE